MTPADLGKVVADRFEILRLAGSGGMGVVYQARDRQSGRNVALKVLLERDQGPAERFAHEVELLSTLEHPHIVGYVAHGITEQGAPYLVMPWLQGIDLQERLDAGPLSIADTFVLARRVADALACLHARNLVHRDLKPSNLFLPDGKVENVQVIDLGVARASVSSEALTLSGMLIGTPGFIAPEQARGDRDVAPAVDIFSFGCVLFECLTGQRLFSGAHLMSVLAKILLEDAPRVRELRPDAPAALDLLVHRMVAKEPEKRPRDGAELVRWLADLERAPPVQTRPIPIHALTASERRMVTVLVVVLPSTRGNSRRDPSETRLEADPFRSSSARFGVRAQPLAERTAVVLAPERVSVADQASVLARFAHYVAETFPGACLALTTGSALSGVRLPMGDAIDRAVTLVRTGAPANRVRVDDVTAALVTSRFDIRREEEGLFLDDERLSLDPTRRLLGRPTPCVGRERELALLETTFAECADVEGPKVVLVTASAGAGKSRVRHELVRRLGAREVAPRVLQCRGDPLRTATPNAMIAQLVREAFGVREREPAERVRESLRRSVVRLVPEADTARVSDFLGELVGAAFDDADRLPLRAARRDAVAMTDQIGRAFEDVLQAWCKQRPLVIVLEDLHWGDNASMKILDRALRKLAGARLFVLALARPEVRERFPVLFPNRDVVEVRLPPIPKRACAKLVREVMGDDAPGDDVEHLVERSAGNGFYLEELIRAAADRARRSSAPPPSSSRFEDLPQTVIAVAQARLERLEPEVRKTLRAASVYGDVFWLEGLSALLGEDPAVLEPIVDALIEQEVIAPSERPRLAGAREFVFRHTLLRGTAYATLTEEDRTLGHRLAAQWLEQVQEDGEVVALHWLEGGERARAAASYSRAGDVRWSSAQTDAAARCAARALLVGDGATETEERISARVMRLASALAATRSLDAREVIIGLERHLPLLDVQTDASLRAIVHAGIERSLQPLRAARDHNRALATTMANAACALGALSDVAGAKKLLAEAKAWARDDATQIRNVLYASAKVAFWAGEAGVTVELLAETLLPEEPRARLEMLLILAVAVVTIEGRAALSRGLDLLSRAEEILGSHANDDPGISSREDAVALVHCAKARFFCFYLAGDYTQAANTAEVAIKIAHRAGLRFDEAAHMHNLGEQYLRLGYPERARIALAESERIARDIGADTIQRHNEVVLAYIDGRGGHLAHLAEGARIANDTMLELFTHYWLGHLLMVKGALEARPALERALHIAGELKVRTMADDCARALASLAARA